MIGPRGDKTYNEHAAIIAAIRSTNLALAERAIDAHLKSIVDDFQVAIEEKHPDSLSESPADFSRHHGRRNLTHNTPARKTGIRDRSALKRR
jgi:hypothetical protein